jgi:hypothetical protein
MLAATVALNVVVTSRMLEASERRWCTTLSVINHRYGGTPPSTEAGRNLAAAFRNLYQEFNCPKE